MCLTSSVKEPSKSSYNIICYKVLKEDMTSPYRDYKYSTITKADGPDSVIELSNDIFLVESGYLHSCKSIKSAKKLRERMLSIFKYKIFKCEIPVGILFYEGKSDDLCSKELKILEEYRD